MRHIFRDKNVLIVNDNESSRKMLAAVIRVVGFRHIEQAEKAGEAFEIFKKSHIDVIIGDIKDGIHDILSLCEMVRKRDESPNKTIPVLAVAGANALHWVNRAKDVMITDLLQSPYSVNNISGKLKYVLNLEQKQLENIAETYQHTDAQAVEGENKKAPDAVTWPDDDEAESLTQTLLDHYLKHHELVFSKLKVAQTATHECMQEVRDVYQKVKDRDNTNVMQFRDFDKMWEDVLNLFMEGGLSEDDIFEIEKLITVIPKDIRREYDRISQQDKSFLALLDSLNATAYKKAKEKVVKLQAQPNPLNGRTSEDYHNQDDDEHESAKAFLFKPRPRVKD